MAERRRSADHGLCPGSNVTVAWQGAPSFHCEARPRARHHRRAIGFPGVLFLPHPLHAHRTSRESHRQKRHHRPHHLRRFESRAAGRVQQAGQRVAARDDRQAGGVATPGRRSRSRLRPWAREPPRPDARAAALSPLQRQLVPGRRADALAGGDGRQHPADNRRDQHL